jgi:alpha-beta hydrolase superfamily lysophospholipase
MLVLTSVTCGCAARSRGTGPDVVFVVAGVGSTGGYAGLTNALSREGRAVQLVDWGAPPPLFMLNFSTRSIHDEAERMLAGQIEQWHEAHPAGRIDIVGHSAGCGVVLGALPRLGQATNVGNVILLAPSVSPTYDLQPVLGKIDGVVHAFHSMRDTLFLSWRTSNFGTYDRVKTKAAGNVGFCGDYPPTKLIQHAYDERWRELGNDGGHFGTLSEPFAREVVAPLFPKD